MSIWENNLNKEERKSFSGERNADTVIIGGGIAGLLTAYKLKNAGANVVVLEQSQIFGGTTKNTTAKITSQHNLIYDKLIKEAGVEKAKMYLKANEEAIKEYSKMCKNLDCDFEFKDSYVYTLDNKEAIENEMKALNTLGFIGKYTENTDLPFEIKGAIKFEKQAQFNPLKFLNEISKDIEIYENSFANLENKNTVVTKNGKIKCKNIVIATHFPFIDRYGFYFAKMYQARSYVLALKNASDVNGMYIDENSEGLSFRNYGDMLLLGGGGHRTGKQGGGYRELEAKRNLLYPKSEIADKWAAQDPITLDGIPYIGKYSKSAPNMYVITGFGKWGMTNAMAGSQLICDLITGRKNEYEELYNPKRFSMNKQFFVNTGETVTGLLGLSTKRCSHLGCKLNFNKQEKTWDCPCHGSRFSESGEIIENPASKNINLKKK